MDYYAHTKAGCSEQDWELLRRHLEEVAEHARCLADRFGAGALGEAAITSTAAAKGFELHAQLTLKQLKPAS